MKEKNLKDNKEIRDARQLYVTAYDMHYSTKDLRKALELYKGVMTSNPDSPEAEYSRTQIDNIVKGVVPRQELLDKLLELALAHL